MTNNDLPKQTEQTATDEMLQQALAHQQAGEFQQAGELYLSILQTEPNHPQANHNMGLLAVQMQQPAASLPYFSAALDADPTRGQYWLNYIDALFRAGQPDDAQQVLALAQQQGLQGDEVDALAIRLKEGAQGSAHPDALQQTRIDSSSGQSANKARPVNTNKATTGHSARKGKTPSQQDINALITLFTSGRLQEATPVAQAMTERFPHHDFGWKALGAIYKQLGRPSEALLPMQKAAMLAPGDVEAHYNLGVTFQELGQPNEAETSYRQAIRIDPNYAQAHSNLGVILQQHDRLEEAESCYRRALRISPGKDKTLSNLGVVLHKLGRFEEAEASYRQALLIDRDNAETHCNLGNTLKELGRPAEAEASYRQAIRLAPGYSEAHLYLGNVLRELKRLDEAETAYQHALQINPNLADLHFNYGNLLAEMERLDDAEASYKKAIATKPDFAEAHYNLGNILLEARRLGEAETCFKRALEIDPNRADANYNLGNTCYLLGRAGEASVYFWKALQIKPDYAEVHCSLGELLYQRGLLDAAQESLQLAIKFNPDSPLSHALLGAILTRMGRLPEAEASCQRALDIDEDYVVAYCNQANAQIDQGLLDKAEQNYRQALKRQPTHSFSYSNLLFCMSHNTKINPRTLFEEHLLFGERFEAPLRDKWPDHQNSRQPDRTLQIGFISGDYKNHPVANFISPVLKQLALDPQLSLHAYANHTFDDALTDQLREHFAHWHRITYLSDEAVAEQISNDGIDILIDLSGHTAENRLLVLARKPAPLQVSWIGYPGTTGLHSIDYYLADRFLLPPGQFDDQFTEKIVRLPATSPFLPHKNAPPVDQLPALKNGHITFGSFNRLNKISRKTITLWSQLLRSLPNSRLVFGGMPQEGKNNVLIEWFAQENIPQERLDFYPRSDIQDYLRLHQQVDICLDTFPYNGGTTTFHAIWMGVPTLSLSGKTAAGRSGAAILGNAGLEAFVAHDEADFVQKGLSWAGKLTELADIREGLREHFANSAAGRPELIAASLARALRIMWQRWCAGMPATSFEVTRQEIENALPKGEQ